MTNSNNVTAVKETVLQRIVRDKAETLKRYQAELPLAQFQGKLVPSDRDFVAALASKPIRFILECKKASPSKGLIRTDFDLAEIAHVYNQHAAAISVLTDEQYFQGHYDYLTFVRSRVSVPVLCKDFIIDPYQIYRARYHGADAVLLMLSVLDDDQWQALAAVATELNMGVLTEVSSEAEMRRAIALKAPVIGINNRDLRDLSITLERTEQLAPMVPPGTVILSESGIKTHADVERLAPLVNGFLVGSALMSEPSLELACRRLIFGQVKICGLTTPEMAHRAAASGASFGGLIFAAASARCVTEVQAATITATRALDFVGVFVDADINEVARLATALGLAAVQLHGDENANYINALRPLLPANCQIWKAHRIGEQLPDFSQWPADRHLLDTFSASVHGGSGQRFDWALLAEHPQRQQLMLAGGLNPANIREARATGVWGLDVNSGVESAPGVKSSELLAALHHQLRNY